MDALKPLLGIPGPSLNQFGNIRALFGIIGSLGNDSAFVGIILGPVLGLFIFVKLWLMAQVGFPLWNP